MILHATLPLPLEQPTAHAGEGPSIRLSARPRTLRLRRHFPGSAGSRSWLLELELDLPEIDPDQLLAGCEGFLVNDGDGRQIGVVVRVERSGPDSTVALLVSVRAGRLRRRHVRVEERAITALVPQERLVIVDARQVTFLGDDSLES